MLQEEPDSGLLCSGDYIFQISASGHTHPGHPSLSPGVIDRQVLSLCHPNFTEYVSIFPLLVSSPSVLQGTFL